MNYIIYLHQLGFSKRVELLWDLTPRTHLDGWPKKRVKRWEKNLQEHENRIKSDTINLLLLKESLNSW